MWKRKSGCTKFLFVSLSLKNVWKSEANINTRKLLIKMVRTFALCTLVWLTTQSASHQTLPFYSVLALLYSPHLHIWSAFDLPCIRTLANLEPVHVSCMFFIVGFSLIRRFETRAFLIWGEGMLLNTEPPLQESFPIINIWIMGKISRIKTEFKNDKLKKERIK